MCAALFELFRLYCCVCWLRVGAFVGACFVVCAVILVIVLVRQLCCNFFGGAVGVFA